MGDICTQVLPSRSAYYLCQRFVSDHYYRFAAVSRLANLSLSQTSQSHLFLGCYECLSLFTLSTCPPLCFLEQGTPDIFLSAGMQLDHIFPLSMRLSMPADSYQSAAEMAVLKCATSLISQRRQCSFFQCQQYVLAYMLSLTSSL